MKRLGSGTCDTVVAVTHSGLNYKDALVVAGRYPGLNTPMVGGCDLVGRVVEGGAAGVQVIRSDDRVF